MPSKTLSYLCAGRPVLGLMPSENLAAALVTEVGGCVLPPSDDSLAEAASWVGSVLTDQDYWTSLGIAARGLAEREFALDRCAGRFESILQYCVASHSTENVLVTLPDEPVVPLQQPA